MKKPLKIGAYLRVSTDKQVQVFEGSLETQKYRMQEFVKARNKEDKRWGEIIEYYIDEGISAGTVKRPQYQKLMTDIKSGKIDLILVADISRLSRSVHDFSQLLKELERRNASYLSMKEQFDTTTPAGRLMINMVVNMAQFEREQTSERVSINCNSRSLRGFVNGGPAGYGFTRSPDKPGMLLIDETAARDVGTIFQIFLQEGSIGKALPVIEALGIHPKKSKSISERINEKKWTSSMLRDLLVNPAYVGLREVNKKNKNVGVEELKPWEQYQLVKAAWPPILKKEIFDEVQRILNENAISERRRTDAGASRIFLLSGILTCAECGRTLCGQSAHGRNSVHRYYKHSDKRNVKNHCAQQRIRADEIEQVVVNHLCHVVSSAGYFKNLESKLKAALENGPKRVEDEIARVKKVLSETETELESTFRFQIRAQEGTEAARMASELIEKLGRRRATLRQHLEELGTFELAASDASDVCVDIEDNMKAFNRGFSKSAPTVRRRLVRRLISRLVLTSKGLEVFFQMSNQGSSFQEVPQEVPNRNFSTNAGKFQALPGPNSDLSLLCGNLPIDGNGWGARTRTWE